MKIYYKSNKLERSLTDPREIRRAFGKMARKVNQRISELKASETLEILKTLPAANCHELKGDYRNKFAVNISENFRMIFEPHHNPIPRKDNGSIDCARITEIKILEVKDYH